MHTRAHTIDNKTTQSTLKSKASEWPDKTNKKETNKIK